MFDFNKKLLTGVLVCGTLFSAQANAWSLFNLQSDVKELTNKMHGYITKMVKNGGSLTAMKKKVCRLCSPAVCMLDGKNFLVYNAICYELCGVGGCNRGFSNSWIGRDKNSPKAILDRYGITKFVHYACNALDLADTTGSWKELSKISGNSDCGVAHSSINVSSPTAISKALSRMTAAKDHVHHGLFHFL